MRFVFGIKLPSLNEIIALNKQQKGKYSPYNEMKQDIEDTLLMDIKATLRDEDAEDWIVWEGSQFTFTWHHPDRRTDPDNTTAGQKFIFDAFVKSGIMVNDNYRYISEIVHRFIHIPGEDHVVMVDISQRIFTPRLNKTLRQQLSGDPMGGDLRIPNTPTT